MPRPLKRGILGASTIILSKAIDKYAFMCGSNFYETDVICRDVICRLFCFMYLSSVLLYMKNKEKFYAKIGHFLLQAFVLDFD